MLTYAAVYGLGKILPGDAAKILWGFFFFFGMGIGLLIRRLMEWLGIGHLLDEGIQRRLTGWSVDYMILATVAAIQVPVVWQYFVPISVMCLLTGVLTTGVVVFLGRRLDGFNLERTVAIYGTVTGTVSTGLLLLRIADPEFETPVAMEIGLMNVIVTPIIAGSMVLVNAPVWWHWSVGLTSLVFAAIGLACLVLIRLLKFWGPRRI
jgi:ESS family glutamate:Na+ symporter